MKKKKVIIPGLSLIVLLVIILGFSFQKAGEMPEPDGKALWQYITETNDYTEWDHWPGMEEMYAGQSPHGTFLKLYVNEKAMKTLTGDMEKIPDNAIIVKENYNDDKELVAVTPMYKVKDYNPGDGDWFWAKYGADGKIMAEGKVSSCIGCHERVKDDDYLFTVSK